MRASPAEMLDFLPSSPAIDEKVFFNLETVGPGKPSGSRTGIRNVCVVAFVRRGLGGCSCGSGGVAAGNELRVFRISC